MNIKNVLIKNLKPYENNPRINKKAVDYVANSIKAFGFKVPIVIDKNNVIVCGHTRYEASKKLKLSEVPCIVADDLTDEQIKAYRLADNKVSELAEWDFSKLENELNDITINMADFGFADEILNDKEKNVETKYNSDVNIPQYEITGRNVGLSDLVDTTKSDELIEHIKQSNAPDDVKQFLINASYRHLRFNYKNIAEYYAQAPKDVQKLMEDSVLVIIDFNDAIENGYVKMNEILKERYGV